MGLGIFTRRPAKNNILFDQLPNLKVVSTVSAGYDHLDIEYLTKKGIRVGNAPQGVGEATADMAMALMLASARNVVPGVQQTMGNKHFER